MVHIIGKSVDWNVNAEKLPCAGLRLNASKPESRLKVTMRCFSLVMTITLGFGLWSYESTVRPPPESDGAVGLKSSSKYLKRQILCIRLKIERGIVRMRVVFVPRSVEIKPLFSELMSELESGKTFKRNWNSLNGLFWFLLFFLPKVFATPCEGAVEIVRLRRVSCGRCLCIALLTKLRHLMEIRSGLGTKQHCNGRIYRTGSFFTSGCGGLTVSLVVVSHSKFVSLRVCK